MVAIWNALVCDVTSFRKRVHPTSAPRPGLYPYRVLQNCGQCRAHLRIELRTRQIDRDFEWMMMDPSWEDWFDSWSGRGFHYRPSWLERTGPSTSDSGGESTGDISFAEVAQSFVGWTKNMAGSLAQSIEPAAMGLDFPEGVVDLSGVDTATGGFLDAVFTFLSGGGGCACACAGCACACAGGGR